LNWSESTRAAAGGGWFRLRLRALRAFSLPVSVLPVLVAAAVVAEPGQWRWDVLAASLVGVALLHAAGNLFNDYFDFLSGVDRKVDGDEGRPGRLLVRGELKPKDVAAEALVCLLAGLAVGMYLLWRCGLGLLWFGLVAAAGLYAYTGPPLKLKYRTLGEVVIFVVFGPTLMAGAGYAQTGRLDWRLVLVGSAVGLATTAILVGNNIRDRQEDRSAKIRTLAHIGAGDLARALYLLLVTGSVIALAALALAGVLPRVVLLAPAMLATLAQPMTCVWRRQRLADIDAATARFETLVLLFVAAALIIDSTLMGG